MAECDKCGSTVYNTSTCEVCGGTYCVKHWDPNDHNCDSLNADNLDNNQQNQSESGGSSGARFIGGTITLLAGVILSITGIGMIFGIPLIMLGFGIAFPRLTLLMVVLAILSFLGLLIVFL